MKKLFILLIVLSCIGMQVNAQFKNLHNFDGDNGKFPIGSLIFSGGMLYGMTTWGGTYHRGCIFSIDTGGKQYKKLHDFNDTLGGFANGALTLLRGVLFGMTSDGGAGDGGCIFSMNTNGSGYKVLYNFNKRDGGSPQGSLTPGIGGDLLYGMTESGGDQGDGFIFSIRPDGSGFKVLHHFEKGYGGFPKGSLTLSARGNVLYGITTNGAENGYGCIFSMDTNGNNYKDLLDFNGTNGVESSGSLTLSGKKLYGMTRKDWSGNGGVFSLDTDGTGFKYLVDFFGPNGATARGTLLIRRDTLYGMTSEGGKDGGGIIFSIDTNGSKFKDLLDFNTINGSNPSGDLIFAGGVFYGMTFSGGAYTYGVIFKFKPKPH